MYHPARAGLLARELHKLNVHVAAIQEVRWPGHGEREFTAVDPIANTSFKYHIYYSGGEKAMHGVGFVVIEDQKNRVIKWKVVNNRICVLRIKGKFFNYSLINIYAPTNDKPDDDKDAFYERLDKTYGECPRHDVKIVIRDANAQVGREAFFHPVIGKESLHPRTNDNGLRLVNFAAARGMAICSTFFARMNIRKHTWRHPNGESGPNIDSDHFLVACKIRTRLSNVSTPRTARIARFNVQRLASSDFAAEYSRKLDERINEDAPTGNLDEQWGALHSIVNTTATEVIGTTRGRKPKGWFDAECQRVTDEKNEARKRMLVKSTRRNCERYSELRRAEKRIHRRKEREYDERVLAEAQAQYNANDKRRFYATVNGDGLPAELFKHGSTRMTEILHQIILRIWCEEQLPNEWLDGLITPIYKKGQRLDCANYRGITILNAAYKVLSRILWSKLRPMTETFVHFNSIQFSFIGE
ncbi:craniofacial development protein 2-like [Culex quinquefasciatus]|uniref:craniofacial development protein 2-like n=1 Tax=Culex quinquefasciatus TaxID=7176 RepID=UPI0018E3B040|nr:craniofacial development protein 2-like [Culex quinquefasciatus]